MIKEKLNWLLNGTRTILIHQKEIEKIKGESFNIFSILKMDRKETISHTPFLAELLNPKGSHLMGNVFLKLFLSMDAVKSVSKISLINTEKIQVTENKHIGAVINEDGREAGGFLDIYISDNNNRSITIENKIDHKKEQEKQVVRYCNFNRPNNVVFYLTPFGTEPSEYSKGKLECNKDFYLLSYKTDIINWLKECLKETGDNAILRQSIRQYIILLQKITFSMENEQEKELDDLMLDYFDEASYISANFEKAKLKTSEELRQAVIHMLEGKFSNEFNIYPGDDTRQHYSQIWIKYKLHDQASLYFGVESFCPNNTEGMYVGILSEGGKPTAYCELEDITAPFWPSYEMLKFENKDLVIDGKILGRVRKDGEFKHKLVSFIVDEIEKFIDRHKVPLCEFLENPTNA